MLIIDVTLSGYRSRRVYFLLFAAFTSAPWVLGQTASSLIQVPQGFAAPDLRSQEAGWKPALLRVMLGFLCGLRFSVLGCVPPYGSAAGVGTVTGPGSIVTTVSKKVLGTNVSPPVVLSAKIP